jgi:hypothetical protein
MRCLYCGKGLALLKRWTGGGEFCSEAHRQQYQEEYNQLALNRLLQAKPASEPEAPAKIEVPEEKLPSAAQAPRVAPPPARPIPLPAATVTPAQAPEPAASVATKTEPDPEAPAGEAGFLVEVPVPAMASAPAAPAGERDFLASARPELPQRHFVPARCGATLAHPVAVTSLQRLVDFCPRPREGRLEVRISVRTAPVIDVDLRPAGEARLEGTSQKRLEIVLPPQSPPTSARGWQETPREFPALDLELGPWARLDFQTTGLPKVSEDSNRPAQSLAPPAGMVIVETTTLAALKASEPVAAALVDKPPVTLPGSKLQPLPEVVTRPVPLTLHGLAAGRAKPVHVFPSALLSGAAVLTPRSGALPLRPAMIFDQAPAASPVRTHEQRTTVGIPVKARKSETIKTEKTEPNKTATPASVVAAAPAPAPPAAPHAAPDLGLPALSLPPSENFWTRMPAGVRASLAATMLALVGGAIFFTAKSDGGKTDHAAPSRIETGAPLPAGATDWIDDFAPDLSRERQRQVSVLRSSVALTDYRMEFHGQIENKAIGWVFRAKDARNFYVTKMEIEKPEPSPAAALISFAVIDGEEQPRRRTPVPMLVRPNTPYTIRVEAVGDRFTTWVQDQKVEEWTDGHIRSGGAGLYNERGEHGSVKGGVSVTPLIRKETRK